jgi:hypothetical protein
MIALTHVAAVNMARVNLGSLVAPPDHEALDGIAITSSSEMLSLKTNLLSRLTFWAFSYAFFVSFSQKRSGLKITDTIISSFQLVLADCFYSVHPKRLKPPILEHVHKNSYLHSTTTQFLSRARIDTNQD